MKQIVLKKKETKMKRVKFFWFARKLSKIQFMELKIREKLGGQSHILYSSLFAICKLQTEMLWTGQPSGSQHSFTNFYFQDFKSFPRSDGSDKENNNI